MTAATRLALLTEDLATLPTTEPVAGVLWRDLSQGGVIKLMDAVPDPPPPDPPPVESDLPLADGVASLAICPQYMVPAWRAAGQPTIEVEKGFGSRVFQDLFPGPDRQLYTVSGGGGQTATEFAAGETLFLETWYNQTLMSQNSFGYPSLAIDASRRVILDLSIPTLPRCRGVGCGVQDPLQHATERGYDLGITIAMNAPFCFITGDQNNPDALDERIRPLQSRSGGEPYIVLTQNNPACSIMPGSVGWHMRPSKLPYTRWIFNGKKTTVAGKRYVCAGRDVTVEAGVNLATSSTLVPMRWLGTTESLNGYGYFCVAITAAEVDRATVQVLGQRLTRLFSGAFAAGQFTVLYPRNNEVIPMDLQMQTADIPITLMGEASTSYEAMHVSGTYAAIGTSDVSGYLEGSLIGAIKNNGTLSIRKVGSGIINTVPTVAIGIVIGKWGQSNMVGRGDDVPHTIPAGFLRVARDVGWKNDTAISKSWLRILQQRLYDRFGCVVASAGYAVGNSYLTRASGSNEAEWDKANPATVLAHAYNEWVSLMQFCSACNWVLGHQGENDAFDGVSASQYKAAQQGLLAGWRSEWRSDLKLHNVSIGKDNASGIKVNPIRYAQQQLWDEEPDNFPALGSLAHLPMTDAVHFATLAEKGAVVDVVCRHLPELGGSGRAPRFSSLFVWVGNTITITCTGGVGPLTIAAMEEDAPIGWTVTDSGGAKAVTSVAVSGMDITLTTSNPVTGSLTVKWLSAGTGVGTTLRDSDLVTPLPPEPFEATVEVL